MRRVTNELIKKFKIDELGFDFMGYSLTSDDDLYTFHHLLIPKINGGPYEIWNGVILCYSSSHKYLHLIEKKDYDMFLYITSEMLEMKFKEYLDEYNLRKIDDCLNYFEKEYADTLSRKRTLIVKPQYLNRNKF